MANLGFGTLAHIPDAGPFKGICANLSPTPATLRRTSQAKIVSAVDIDGRPR